MDCLRDEVTSSVTSTAAASTDPATTSHRMWEYESLLFAQNNLRQVYNLRQNRPRPSSGSPHSEAGSCGEEASGDSVFLPDQSDQSAEDTKVTKMAKTRDLEDGSDKTRAKSTMCEVRKNSSGYCRFLSHKNECNSDGSKRVFAPIDPFDDILNSEKYRASWDIDLLNLNVDLTPMQDPTCVESSLAHIFAEDETSQKFCCMPATAKSAVSTYLNALYSESDSNPFLRTKHFSVDPSAIIISHPHGGRKMVSSGFFSRHFHVGGTLYDTPTCMGSCGAPVISLAGDGSGPLVTYLVHAGTVNVNGISAGMGVDFFPQIKSS